MQVDKDEHRVEGRKPGDERRQGRCLTGQFCTDISAVLGIAENNQNLNAEHQKP
jgi:hypothetical protein